MWGGELLDILKNFLFHYFYFNLSVTLNERNWSLRRQFCTLLHGYRLFTLVFQMKVCEPTAYIVPLVFFFQKKKIYFSMKVQLFIPKTRKNLHSEVQQKVSVSSKSLLQSNFLSLEGCCILGVKFQIVQCKWRHVFYQDNVRHTPQPK